VASSSSTTRISRCSSMWTHSRRENFFAPLDLRVRKVGYARAVKALSGIAAALLLLAAPSGTMAQAPLPIGESHGVRLVRERGALVFVFTDRAAKRWRRIAGRWISVDCTDHAPSAGGPPRARTFVGPPHPGDITEESGGGVTMRAPRRGRRLETGDGTRGMDFCRLFLEPRSFRFGGSRQRGEPRLIVSVPLTQSGAVFLDEQNKARRLMVTLSIAGFVAEELKITGWPSFTQLVDAVGNTGSRLRFASLAAPTDTPPARRIGYYSDRREHVAVAILSRSGRRLFFEVSGDVLTTNITEHVFGDG
jgi:hypothetical protein